MKYTKQYWIDYVKVSPEPNIITLRKGSNIRVVAPLYYILNGLGLIEEYIRCVTNFPLEALDTATISVEGRKVYYNFHGAFNWGMSDIEGGGRTWHFWRMLEDVYEEHYGRPKDCYSEIASLIRGHDQFLRYYNLIRVGGVTDKNIKLPEVEWI